MEPSIRWKRLFPSYIGDRLSAIFALSELWVEGLFELFIILPRLYPEATTSYWLAVTIGSFLFVNAFGNLMMAMCTDISSGKTILPSVLEPAWSYCHQCLQNSPPRSYHCTLCDACVLKRDHHCLFIGSCIGHANHRYYLMCVMYLSLGALYANYLNFEIAVECVRENMGWKMLIAAFTPMFGWLIAPSYGVSFFIAFQSGTCVLAMMGFVVLFVFHTGIALRGQVTFELRRSRDKSYDLGILENVREVLGTRWYLVWIFPLIRSPLPGDGLYFKRRSAVILEDVKDL